MPFTQEFLADMLGVRRTSISPAAHDLQRMGLITYTRGRIQLVDRDGLKAVACECYETVRGHYDDLVGADDGPKPLENAGRVSRQFGNA